MDKRCVVSAAKRKNIRNWRLAAFVNVGCVETAPPIRNSFLLAIFAERAETNESEDDRVGIF